MAKSSTDLVAQLVHQYFTDNGYKAEAVKLAKKLNLDTRAGLPDFCLLDMFPQESDPSVPTLGLLVHSYLEVRGYHDCAKKLALILNLDITQDLQGKTLEQIWHAYQRASSVTVKNNISSSPNVTEKAEIDLSTSPNPELTMSKGQRGGVL